MSDHVESQLVNKPGSTSAVWAYFGFEPGSDGKPENLELAVCHLCHRKVRTRGSNTSNLFSHLRTTHAKEYSIVKDAKQTKKVKSTEKGESSEQLSIVQALGRNEKYSRSSKRWAEVTDAITYCMAKDLMPIYSVEKEGFQRLVSTLDRKYELPGRKYFSQTAIPRLYADTRDTVMAELKSISWFSATTDMWSSRTMEPYMSYTVHFIDQEWCLRNRCLQTLFLPEDHTANNIMDALKATLESWSLPVEKLICTTTDNGSNIMAATDRLDWERLSCFGHNLHLAITNSFKDDTRTTRAFGVCHKLIGSFSHSWNKRRELSKAQVTLGIPQHSLITVRYRYSKILVFNSIFFPHIRIVLPDGGQSKR